MNDIVFNLNIWFKPELEKISLQFLRLLVKKNKTEFSFERILENIAVSIEYDGEIKDKTTKKLNSIVYSSVTYPNPWYIIEFLKRHKLIEEGFTGYRITSKGRILVHKLSSGCIFVKKIGTIIFDKLFF